VSEKRLKRWAWRSNQLEVSSCDENLLHSKVQDKAEICQWSEDNTCKWTVAVFDKTKDGYDLRWVGDRPLKASRKDFYACAKVGFLILSGQVIDE
jgi:hypothetical protein